jgi:hypothetical protein
MEWINGLEYFIVLWICLEDHSIISLSLLLVGYKSVFMRKDYGLLVIINISWSCDQFERYYHQFLELLFGNWLFVTHLSSSSLCSIYNYWLCKLRLYLVNWVFMDLWAGFVIILHGFLGNSLLNIFFYLFLYMVLSEL